MRYRFERSGRTVPAAVTLLLVWAALLTLWIVVQAAAWLMALLLAATVPAALDFAFARRSGLSLDTTHLRWWSGRHHGDARLGAIDHVRLERRFDMTVRVRLVLPDARRVTLPQAALPPVDRLTQALDDHGVAWQRHPFALL